MRTGGVLPVAIGCKQQTRANDVLMTCTELGRCVERLPDRRLRLQERVAWVENLAIGEWRGAADRS